MLLFPIAEDNIAFYVAIKNITETLKGVCCHIIQTSVLWTSILQIPSLTQVPHRG